MYSVQYRLIQNTNVKKIFLWAKQTVQKYPLFFLSRAPTRRDFTLNLRFLSKLKLKVSLPKTVRGIFHFRFRFVFIKVYIFVQQNAWTLLL